MKFAAVTALSCLSLGALGLVAPVNPLEGRTIREATWGFQVFPGGPTLPFNGTIQEVHAQLLELNPDWDAQFPRPQSIKEKRSDDFQVHCGKPWRDCSTSRIKEGIDYLHGVSGKPYLIGGPAECSRVSCSYGAAIWWCNDDLEPKTLWSFPLIAYATSRVVNECAKNSASSVAGQVFHVENWNVVVTKGNC